MDRREQRAIAIVLFLILAIVIADVANDFSEGVDLWHLILEGCIAVAATAGIFLLIRGTFILRHSLEEEQTLKSRLQADAEHWKQQSRKHVEGLSRAIDDQLSKWELTASEKEVALLLLKGVSLKEIAELRQTTEKTTRAQATSIYSKAGLAGRSELSAFFLEDLLVPRSNGTSQCYLQPQPPQQD